MLTRAYELHRASDDADQEQPASVDRIDSDSLSEAVAGIARVLALDPDRAQLLDLHARNLARALRAEVRRSAAMQVDEAVTLSGDDLPACLQTPTLEVVDDAHHQALELVPEPLTLLAGGSPPCKNHPGRLAVQTRGPYSGLCAECREARSADHARAIRDGLHRRAAEVAR